MINARINTIVFLIISTFRYEIPTRNPTLFDNFYGHPTRYGKFGWGKNRKNSYNYSCKVGEGGYRSCRRFEKNAGYPMTELQVMSPASANVPGDHHQFIIIY